MAVRKLTINPSPVQRAFADCRDSTDMQSESGISLDEQRVKIEVRCLEMDPDRGRSALRDAIAQFGQSRSTWKGRLSRRVAPATITAVNLTR